MPESKRIYWDADVFLSYINNLPDRAPTIEAILDKVATDKDLKIVTSVVSRVEVAWASIEQINRVLSNDTIALNARGLMRQAMENGGRRLRTNDAIHLASAIWAKVIEYNTYNIRDYQFFIPLVQFPIQVPIAQQPKLV